MDSIVLIFIIFGLFCVILAEFIFLIYVIDYTNKEKVRLLDEITKVNTALVAKDANDYVMRRTMDNVVQTETKREPEGVDASELTNEEYDKMLKETLKVGA